MLSDLFILRGIPSHVRSDKPPEFVSKQSVNGSRPWENGYRESFNSKLLDELLKGEIFYTLEEAKVIIESWRPGQH